MVVAVTVARQKEKRYTSQESSVLFANEGFTLERVPLMIRHAVSQLFLSSTTDYTRIFEHLLHYATVRQQTLEEGDDDGSDVAIIRIPNQWKLYTQDTRWPCCYATLNTFIRLLCALGILRKQMRRQGQVTHYLLPLTPFCFRSDAILALDALIDPVQTKNPKVRQMAERVKSRLLLFCYAQPQSTGIQEEMGDAVLQKAVIEMQHLVLPLMTGMGSREKQQLMIHMSKIMVQLSTDRKSQSGRFSADVPDLSFLLEKHLMDNQRPKGDSDSPLVDSSRNGLTREKVKTVDSSVVVDSQQALLPESQSLLVDCGTNESTVSHQHDTSSAESTEQNLLSQSTNKQPLVDFGEQRSQNLPFDAPLVDSHDDNDNDGNTYHKNIPKEKDTVIDGIAIAQQKQPSFRPLDVRAAQRIATFVEGHTGNFRSYIALSKKYHPQILRAAILNMLTHSVFPDLTGELSSDVDGEMTGKIGRPKKPGAWVTACCQAYSQYGIPPIMHLLLQEYSAPYDEVRKQLAARSQELSSVQFWMLWQEQLLTRQQGQPSSEQQPLSVPVESFSQERGSPFKTHAGMNRSEAQELVTQMNHEGYAYQIHACPRLQDGQWEVEVEIPFEGQSSTYIFYSRHQWDAYVQEIQSLSQ